MLSLEDIEIKKSIPNQEGTHLLFSPHFEPPNSGGVSVLLDVPLKCSCFVPLSSGLPGSPFPSAVHSPRLAECQAMAPCRLFADHPALRARPLTPTALSVPFAGCLATDILAHIVCPICFFVHPIASTMGLEKGFFSNICI